MRTDWGSNAPEGNVEQKTNSAIKLMAFALCCATIFAILIAPVTRSWSASIDQKTRQRDEKWSIVRGELEASIGEFGDTAVVVAKASAWTIFASTALFLLIALFGIGRGVARSSTVQPLPYDRPVMLNGNRVYDPRNGTVRELTREQKPSAAYTQSISAFEMTRAERARARWESASEAIATSRQSQPQFPRVIDAGGGEIEQRSRK